MTYLVEQYADSFFVIKKISGYKSPFVLGTKISEAEYTKLYNSNPTQRERIKGVQGNKGAISFFKIPGNAKIILGKEDIITIEARK